MKQDLGSGIWKVNPTSHRSTRGGDGGGQEGGRDSRRQKEFLVCPLGSTPGSSVSEPNKISSGSGMGTEAFCLFLSANDCHWALESNTSKHHLL